MAAAPQETEGRQLRSRETVGVPWGVGRMDLPCAPTFYPSEEEFADFPALINRIVEEAREFGIAKVVPPPSWGSQPTAPPAGDYALSGAIRQHITGSNGLYTVLHEQQKGMTHQRFVKQADSYATRERVPPQASHDALEEKFWSELIGARAPLYAADLDGSLFRDEDEGRQSWNLNKLPDLLRVGPTALTEQMSGVNTPMLYFGSFRTLFCLHTEDMDLFSINYLHYGGSKQWYGVPPRSATLVEMVAAQCNPEAQGECKEFLRHKTTLISPDVLCANGVPCCKLRQHEGEFVITLPRAYHFGCNLGKNCAESTNFALPSWIPIGRGASVCSCTRGTGLATIDMRRFDEILADHNAISGSSRRPMIAQGRVGKACGTPGCKLPDFHDGPCTSNAAMKRLRGSKLPDEGASSGSGTHSKSTKPPSQAPATTSPNGKAVVTGESMRAGSARAGEGADGAESDDGHEAAAVKARGSSSLFIPPALLNKVPAGIAPWIAFPDVERYERDTTGRARSVNDAERPSKKRGGPPKSVVKQQSSSVAGQLKKASVEADAQPPLPQRPTQSPPKPPLAPPPPPPLPRPPRPANTPSATTPMPAVPVTGVSGLDLSSVLQPRKESAKRKRALDSVSLSSDGDAMPAHVPVRGQTSRKTPMGWGAQAASTGVEQEMMLRAIRESVADERDRRQRARAIRMGSSDGANGAEVKGRK